MKQRFLCLMVGAPGCGKTTYLATHARPEDVVVSRDAIRFSLLSPEDDYFAKEKEVWRIFIATIQNAIDNESVEKIYVDATHLNAKSRHAVLSQLNFDENVIVCTICFNVCLAVCLQRNAMRTGRARVPEDSIVNMFSSLRFPKVGGERYINFSIIVDRDGEIMDFETIGRTCKDAQNLANFRLAFQS